MADSEPDSALQTFANRMTRQASLYAFASLGRLALWLLYTGVLTRLLEPADFGRLALLMLIAVSLTLVCSMGTLQGTLSWVAGSTGGGEGDEGIEDEQDDAGKPQAKDRRRALGTGLVLMMGTAALGTLAVTATAAWIAELLLHDVLSAPLVTVAAVAGGFGSLWRLAAYLPRLEGRRVAYNALTLLRPTLVIAASGSLVAAGTGIGGAIAGLALGNAVATLLALLIGRRQFRIVFRREDARQILGRGTPLVPILMVFWIVHHCDLLVLSFFSADSTVALYRVGSRLGNGVLYALSALLMAWGPLLGEPLGQAMKRERAPQAANAALLTYFVLAAVAAVSLITVAAEYLVRVAPPEYAGAAGLVPLLGLGFALNGVYVATYRVVKLPDKRRAYSRSALCCLVAFAAALIVLVPPYRAYGAATAVAAAFAAGTVYLLIRSQRGPDPLPLRYRQIVGGPALAALCLGSARVVGGTDPISGTLALAALAVLVVPLGVLQRTHMGPLASVVAALLPRRAVPRLAERLRALPVEDRNLLRRFVRERRPAAEVAEACGVEPASVFPRATALIGELSGLREQTAELAGPTAAYLFSAAPGREADQIARALVAQGADPLELDRLAITVKALRRCRRSAFGTLRPIRSPPAPQRAGAP